jgi:hypothetical protein
MHYKLWSPGDGLNQVEIVFTHSKSMDQNGIKHAHKGLEVQYSLHSTVEVKRTYGKCIIFHPSIHPSIHPCIHHSSAVCIFNTFNFVVTSVVNFTYQCTVQVPRPPYPTWDQPPTSSGLGKRTHLSTSLEQLPTSRYSGTRGYLFTC